MDRSSNKLREDAQRIWWEGVEAVQPKHIIPQFVCVRNGLLQIGDEQIELRDIGRIVVVGAGKAGASMAVALEAALGKDILQEKRVTGWVNVPEDCLQPTLAVTLHGARPAGVNEPTEEGVQGTQRILDLVAELGSDDLCICLISGGGSALLPAPVEGLSLRDKVSLTREISARGGSIQQLNDVRRELSLVKGGGLAMTCRAGRLIALILSDVLGDDLETIASGPTVLREPTPERAINVLHEMDLTEMPAGKNALQVLKHSRKQRVEAISHVPEVTNLIVGNNAAAVDAAGIEAERLGYRHAMASAVESEGSAESVADRLVEMAQRMRQSGEPDCLIWGGEPTVELARVEERGLGGRNQHLALAALSKLEDWKGLALLSAGTDGEDGPTDAAGALVDCQIARQAEVMSLNPSTYLQRSDAYHFFEEVGGLFKTGPTQTNVCDLRVLTVSQGE